MPIHAIHHDEGTFDHRCPRCGVVREGLRIDPARWHLTIFRDYAGNAVSVVTAPCPTCAQEKHPESGQPIFQVECFTLNIPAYEVGEGNHPGSLVGTRFEDTGAVVTEHTHGYSLDPQIVAHKRLIRALQAHPHLAKHAPPRL